MKKLVIGISGSSGSIYAQLIVRKLMDIRAQWDEIGIVASKNAYVNWKLELGVDMSFPKPITLYDNQDFHAPFASGSAKYDTMIICPCSMGTLGRVAHGLSDNLMTRAADVIIKEKRKLILVPRETPFSLIHLRNMTALAECGAYIVPAIPSFYTQPETVQSVLETVIDRILDLAGFTIQSKRWGS